MASVLAAREEATVGAGSDADVLDAVPVVAVVARFAAAARETGRLVAAQAGRRELRHRLGVQVGRRVAIR